MGSERVIRSLAELAQLAHSRELTGVELPGLSANPLRVEPWWRDRPVVGRGPDNEPLAVD